MSNLQLQPPEPFNFRNPNPDEWMRWKRQYEQVGTASEIKSADETHPALLVGGGSRRREEGKQYNTVMSKLDGCFKVRKILIFERARFNQRKQSEGELVE